MVLELFCEHGRLEFLLFSTNTYDIAIYAASCIKIHFLQQVYYKIVLFRFEYIFFSISLMTFQSNDFFKMTYRYLGAKEVVNLMSTYK